jgi:drug/metabolite transporter (DMT)-like permease
MRRSLRSLNVAVAGAMVLGEALTPMQLVGTGVILGGVLVVNWPARET